jgi:hypothetical protein
MALIPPKTSGVEEKPREPTKKRTDQILLLTFPGRSQKMFEYRLLDEWRDGPQDTGMSESIEPISKKPTHLR